MTGEHRPARRGLGPVALVMLSVGSVQFGAAFAKTLFDEVTPSTLVWLRLFTSAVVLMCFARPRLRGHTRRDWLVVLALGLSLGGMNWSFYQAFSRLPLGVAVALEFSGPLLLAVATSGRARDLGWIGLAGVGVALFGVERTALDWVGLVFVFCAAAFWALYIVVAGHTGRQWRGFDGLALASVVGAVVVTPAMLADHPSALGSGHVWLVGLAVGVLSSVIPYSAELVALRSLPPSVFGVLLSLEPAVAALFGWLVVGEVLGPLQWAALGCVVVASIAMTRSGKEQLPAGS